MKCGNATRGKTYEEIHGKKKAAELLEKRRLQKVKYWANKQKLGETARENND